MREREDVYAEIERMAERIFAHADVRAKSLGLSRMDLSTLYSLRMGSIRQGNFDVAAVVSHEIVRREIESARKDRGSKSHAKVVLALVSMLRQTAGANRGTERSARAMSADLVAGIPAHPEWLKQYLKNAPVVAKPTDVTVLTGLSVADWNAFVVTVVEATAGRSTPGWGPQSEPGAVDLNVAARLSRMAAREESVARPAPTYDLSDKRAKISRVTVTGFRGSPGTAALDLTRKGQPVDVLLWGDNGVGKSTLVDGIEFALQHRVDRSSDFNSSLRSAVRNLTVPSAHAEVELSDGTVSARSLVTNKAGRDEPSNFAVRPGFRIAPVVIRRADILRFLDTDALSRGTVFFDYFPDPSGTLGVRPDEELRQLEEERFLLRVARDDLASQLASIYPGADTDFGDSQKLELFVSYLTSKAGVTEYEQPIDALPYEAREIVTELRSAQRRGSEIKKKLDRGVQTLNPVAYRSQLDRIVPILQTVTSDLTASFKRIASADHVTALRVLVAKSGPVSLDVVVEFDDGKSALPQQAFSEGYKDLIALLFFLTMTKKSADFGQARVLVLDDALQSVDSSIRLGVMEYVLDEFKNWQLIVTGHDRAWLAQLRGLFQRSGRGFVERNISSWSYTRGIQVAGSSRSRAESLREAIDRADERMTSSGIGVLLEEVAAELSWRLGVSVIRKEEDRYTLGDLWPGVAKALKATSQRELISAINLRIDIRNLVGAHYNEWADGIPWSDIRRLGEDSLAVYDATYCLRCASWVQKLRGQIACTCGVLVLK